MGDRVPLEEEKEGAEEAIIIGLATQMSHHFPPSPIEITCMTVQACLIAETTTEEGVVSEIYRFCCRRFYYIHWICSRMQPQMKV
jgi:hypothetical protein